MLPLYTYVKISSRGNCYPELYSNIERKRGGEKKKRIFCESFAKVPTKFPTRNAKGEEQFIFPEELFSCMLRKYPFDQTAPTNRNIVRPTFSIFQLSISFFPSLALFLSLSPALSFTLKINIDFKRRRARDIFRKVWGLLS